MSVQHQSSSHGFSTCRSLMSSVQFCCRIRRVYPVASFALAYFLGTPRWVSCSEPFSVFRNHLFVEFNLTGQLPTVYQQPSPVAHGLRLPRFSVRLFSTIPLQLPQKALSLSCFDGNHANFLCVVDEFVYQSFLVHGPMGAIQNLEKAVPLVLANLSLHQASGCARLRPRLAFLGAIDARP